MLNIQLTARTGFKLALTAEPSSTTDQIGQDICQKNRKDTDAMSRDQTINTTDFQTAFQYAVNRRQQQFHQGSHPAMQPTGVFGYMQMASCHIRPWDRGYYANIELVAEHRSGTRPFEIEIGLGGLGGVHLSGRPNGEVRCYWYEIRDNNEKRLYHASYEATVGCVLAVCGAHFGLPGDKFLTEACRLGWVTTIDFTEILRVMAVPPRRFRLTPQVEALYAAHAAHADIPE